MKILLDPSTTTPDGKPNGVEVAIPPSKLLAADPVPATMEMIPLLVIFRITMLDESAM